MMERYAFNQENRSVVTFFLLNARLLLSRGLSLSTRDFSGTDMLNSKRRSFRWTNGLLNVLGFYLKQVVDILK